MGLDWLAAIFELTGSWFVGEKKRIAFLILICGSITWAIVACQKHLYGLLITTGIFTVINIRNWIKWGK